MEKTGSWRRSITSSHPRIKLSLSISTLSSSESKKHRKPSTNRRLTV